MGLLSHENLIEYFSQLDTKVMVIKPIPVLYGLVDFPINVLSIDNNVFAYMESK